MARVVACVPDLMDRSKVEAAARAAGVALDLVAKPAHLVGAVHPGCAAHAGVDLVIVDLSRPGALEAVRELGGRARTVGFGSHVDRDLLGAAREAGCDQVMARSAFFTRLREILGAEGAGAGGAGAEGVGAPAQPSAATNSWDVIGSENIGKS